MKKLVCLIMCLLLCTLPACTTKTGGGVFGGLGDGKLDAVEAASLSLVVGGYLSANKSAVVPTYDITTILITIIDNKSLVSVAIIDEYILKEAEKMHLDQTTLLTLKDLVVLVKAKISEDIKATNLSENDKLVLVHDVLVVIQKAAEARK